MSADIEKRCWKISNGEESRGENENDYQRRRLLSANTAIYQREEMFIYSQI